MAKKITIAIDGHSACGKSTLAKDLARALNYLYVDSGAMYRATTYFFQLNDIDLDDPLAVDRCLQEMELDIRIGPSGHSELYFREILLSEQLRTVEINNLVSEVAALPSVRKHLVSMQQRIGTDSGVVMDGRDIGSVVFPAAELKIFLTASLAVRTLRRSDELHSKGISITPEEVEQNLRHRDHLDSTRKTSPLIKTPDAVVIDNSNLNREEQLEMIVALAKLRMR
ncbi:MAG: (d)CMP kinase [Saprospiraceae bacterium]|nr:(d)CMP kinase [Saprospiraceae bacterium]